MAWYNPTDPKQRNWMLAGIVTLVLIVPYNMYLLSPRQDENAAIQQRVQNLQDGNRRARLIAAQGGEQLQERLALYEAHVAKLEELIPAQEEVPGLIDDIQTQARIQNVAPRLLEPQPRELGELYDRTAYNMSVIGEYHSVARFLTDIASLDRIVTPVQVEIQVYDQPDQYPDLESPVVASFRIETYVLPDSTAAPPPAPAPGA